jgi:hypothetical protein
VDYGTGFDAAERTEWPGGEQVALTWVIGEDVDAEV